MVGLWSVSARTDGYVIADWSVYMTVEVHDGTRPASRFAVAPHEMRTTYAALEAHGLASKVWAKDKSIASLLARLHFVVVSHK